ncbi:MAG: C39 family peptidase [Chloroflexi bacterium]|nr:C39 family peptidase [Chloroflexota bacterium]
MSLLPVSHRSQLQSADCLAACAAMVLDYLDVSFDYDDLLDLLRITPFGAKFQNLVYLESLGVKVLTARGELETLATHLKRGVPPIAFVKTAELSYWDEANNHAVVIIGIEGRQVFVNDPAFADAPKRIWVDEFMLAWMDMDQFYGLIEKED